MVLNTEQLHHEVIQLNVGECIHHINVVCYGMPALVWPLQEAREEGTRLARLLDGFGDSGKGTMRDEHGVHRWVGVVVPMVLHTHI